MVQDTNRKHLLPPHVSYRTFLNFIGRMQQNGIPNRVDKSYWSEQLSNGNGTHMMETLRFLGLLDTNDIPTPRLKQLVNARGEARTQLLRQITSDVFVFLREGSLVPETATLNQLQENFRDAYQTTNDVQRKCVKFFVELSKDAGIELPTYLTNKFRSGNGTSGTGTKVPSKRSGTKPIRNLVVPQHHEGVEQMAVSASLADILMQKLPNFDPTWSDEVQQKWLAAFDEISKRLLPRDGNGR